ncbi:MAG: hypothetical protein ACTSYD_05025 [Candidatus Heimdallarchaeaceae archaeon]
MNKKFLKLFFAGMMMVILSTLPVMALEKALFENTETIPQNEYYGIWAMLDANSTYHLSANGSGPFDLLLLDEANFLHYNETFHGNNQAYTPEQVFTNTTEEALNITFTQDIKLYIIIENADITPSGANSIGNITVTLKLDLIISVKAPGYTLPVTLPALLFVSVIFVLRKRKK